MSEGNSLKLTAIAFWVGLVNFFSSKNDAKKETDLAPVTQQESLVENFKIEKTEAEPSILPIQEAITEGIKIEKTEAEPSILPIQETITEGVKIEKTEAEPSILPIQEAIVEEVKIEKIETESSILPIQEAIIEEVKIEKIETEASILPIQEAIIEEVKIEKVEAESNILPIQEAIIEEVKIEKIETVSNILPIQEGITDGTSRDNREGIKIEEIKIEPSVLPTEVAFVEPIHIEAEKAEITQNTDISAPVIVAEQADLVTLAEEIATVEQYLASEKIRLGDKLSYSFEIEEESLNQKIPPIIIQMLTENAVKYGVQETEEGGYVNIQSFVYDNFLTIEIKNSGQLKEDPSVTSSSGSGVYIENTLKKLGKMFGENGFFSIENASENEVVATVCVPAIEQ